MVELVECPVCDMRGSLRAIIRHLRRRHFRSGACWCGAVCDTNRKAERHFRFMRESIRDHYEWYAVINALGSIDEHDAQKSIEDFVESVNKTVCLLKAFGVGPHQVAQAMGALRPEAFSDQAAQAMDALRADAIQVE